MIERNERALERPQGATRSDLSRATLERPQGATSPSEPVRAGASSEQAEERFRSVSCGERVRGARASEVPFRPTAYGRKGSRVRRRSKGEAKDDERRNFLVRPGGSSTFSVVYGYGVNGVSHGRPIGPRVIAERAERRSK